MGWPKYDEDIRDAIDERWMNKDPERTALTEYYKRLCGETSSGGYHKRATYHISKKRCVRVA